MTKPRPPNNYIYKSSNNVKHKYRTTENLVPILAKADFDNVAQDFLSTFYPEALENAISVDVAEVVRRMGLEIQETSLSRDSSVFGAMVFSDCMIDVWNNDAQRHEPINAKGGTILIDPKVFSGRNTGSYRNTIIHECVHWFLHRDYHWLSSFYSSDTRYIKCPAGSGSKSKWSDLDWMEWQANGIAPRILMPREQTRQIYERITYWVEGYKGRISHTDMLDIILHQLAKHFGVSLAMAKIRLLDLGYRDFEGVSTYINNHYISNYSFNTESKRNNQTFCISFADSFYLYQTNKSFQAVINSGNFIYVDGFHVLNNPKYILRNIRGELALTRHAKQNIDECCLRFDLIMNTASNLRYGFLGRVVMFRIAATDYSRIPHFNQDKHNMELFNSSEDMKKFYNEIVEDICQAYQLEITFSQFAWKIIRQKGINKQVFQEKTLLSGRMFERIRDNQLTAPKIETVMSICLGLDLGGQIGEQLLERAGHKLNGSLPHTVYRKLLYSLRGKTIYDYNEILEALSLPPLTKYN